MHYNTHMYQHYSYVLHRHYNTGTYWNCCICVSMHTVKHIGCFINKYPSLEACSTAILSTSLSSESFVFLAHKNRLRQGTIPCSNVRNTNLSYNG